MFCFFLTPLHTVQVSYASWESCDHEYYKVTSSNSYHMWHKINKLMKVNESSHFKSSIVQLCGCIYVGRRTHIYYYEKLK